MNPFKSKILFIIFIVFFLFSFPVANAENINTENLESDDTYVYSYFNTFLKDYESTINHMIQNNNTFINESQLIFQKTVQLNLEITEYTENGMTTPAKTVTPPFYNFSKNLKEISYFVQDYDENLKLNTTNNQYFAKLAALRIIEKIDLMRNNLDDIKNISELKKDNETLVFDTGDVETSLYYLELKMINNIEKIGNVSPTSNLTIHISPNNPTIYKNALIYGTGQNGNATIVITGPKNTSENILLTNNYYSEIHSFEKAGTYNLTLTQGHKKSETISVNVSKIHTDLIVKSYFEFPILKENTITGKVIDSDGSPVDFGTVILGNETIPVENGTFKTYIYSDFEKIEKFTLNFIETEKYMPTQENITINFVKPPLNIQIYSENRKISPNQSCIITGNFEGDNSDLNLKLWVDNNPVENFNSDNSFKKEISFEKAGNYTVFVTFAGNEQYRYSKSNVLTINVVDKKPLITTISQNIKVNWKILLLAFIILIFGTKIPTLVKKYSTRNENISKNNMAEVTDRVSSDVFEKVIPSAKTITSQYQKLYRKLTKKYNIVSELTPNELLNCVLKFNPEIYQDLQIITDIHEIAVYGEKHVEDSTVKNFYELIEHVMENV
ncbi:hypothetical protein [Methanococcus sp. CF]